MTQTAAPGPVPASAIGRGMVVSVVAHALAAFGLVALARDGDAPPPRTAYRVALVAAPSAAGTARPARDLTTPTDAVAAPRAPAATERTVSASSARATARPARPIMHRVVPRTAPVAKPAPAITRARTAPAIAPKSAPRPVPTSAPKPILKPESNPARVHAVPGHATAHAPASRTTDPPATKHAAVPQAPHAAGAKPSTGTPAARGRDVADVRVVGLEFPFPGYLDNLVRQVRFRFSPTQASAPLHADLAFVVGRDGSVGGLRVVRSSGNYAFDLEAQGAVEAAGSARAFGPLPDGFRGSALPVTFSFDPHSVP